MKKIAAFALGFGVLTACTGEKSIEEQIKVKKEKLAELQMKFKEAEAPLKKEIDSLMALSTNTGYDDLIKVEALKVEAQPFDSYFEVHGVVETNQNIQVMPETQGIIQSIKVKEGQKVKRGQTLAVLDTELINKQIAEVKKSLELASTMFEKQQKLRDQNVGTEVEYLQSKNQKESLERSLSTLNSQLNKAVIKAPIAGRIDDIFSNEGEMATAMSPFARIINLDEVYIKADVSEASLGKINVGDEVSVNVPSLNKKVKASISYVGNYINPLNRTFVIHVNLHNKDKVFLPNLLTELTIRDAHLDNAVTVPTKVILNDGKNNYAYVISKEDGSDVVKKQVIEAGVDYNGSTVINKGLEAGQLIVVKGQTVVSSGTKVSIAQ